MVLSEIKDMIIRDGFYKARKDLIRIGLVTNVTRTGVDKAGNTSSVYIQFANGETANLDIY